MSARGERRSSKAAAAAAAAFRAAGMRLGSAALELVRAVEGGKEVVSLNFGVYPSESEVAAIARAVGESGKVKRLNLYDKQITDVGASAVAEAVARSTSLTELVLGGNKITDVGATKLAEAVARSTSLTVLDLGYNQITDVGASALAEAVVRSTSLTELSLSFNKITDVGATKLADVVAASKSLTLLDLCYNQITDIGACALAKTLARSSKLNVYVRGRELTELGSRALDAARATTKATRPTLWLLGGTPTSPSSPAILWRRFLLHKDGDHAMWARVMDFLADPLTTFRSLG